MTATQSADIFGFRKITKQCLLESCKKNKLYRTPALNDVLYLHYQGFEDIECLEEYTGLKCIWLECNALSKISGLDNQKLLKCLFLHNNVIKNIENLESCPELDTVNLSHNHITKIENCGVDKLPVLTTLNLSHNYLRTYDSLANLVDCKMLSVLDLANNRIEDILCVKIFAQMPELRVLVLQGNPVVNQIPQYRKTLILDCLKLTYLDSRPVFPRDRACAEAWKQGGYEAERIEHARWNREERKKMRQSVNATLRLKNRGGGDPQPQLLMSSDDEDAGATELSSAPSLEKEQLNKAGVSTELLKSSAKNEDSDSNSDSSSDSNSETNTDVQSDSDSDTIQNENTAYDCNKEKRCLVCARPNCNVEHVKKRQRVRNLEEPETILENSFIFNFAEEYQKETIKNQDYDEENKLYNDVYHKNIQYINEVVNNKKNELISVDNIEPFNQKKAVNVTESATVVNNSYSNLLIRNREQDNTISELSVLPPSKKIKLTEEEDNPQMQNNENIVENSFNSTSHVIALDDMKETEKIILNDNKKNDQVIDKQLYDNNSDGKLETQSNEHTNCILSEINNDNKIFNFNDFSDMNSKIEANHAEDLGVNDNSINKEKNVVKESETLSDIKDKNEINVLDTNLETVVKDASANIDIKKAVQQVKDNNSYITNTFPILFSSRLYLGTDTNINSAITLYEMHNRKEYNSENESNEFKTIYKNMKDDEESKNLLINNKDVEIENIEPKMEIIDRLLKNPITKTFKYDSTKIHDEFEILKNNETKSYNSTLETFLKIENNNAETINCNTKELGVHVSKSEEIIIQNDLNTDDEEKNVVETHSSDTRIIKINYNI